MQDKNMNSTLRRSLRA